MKPWLAPKRLIISRTYQPYFFGSSGLLVAPIGTFQGKTPSTLETDSPSGSRKKQLKYKLAAQASASSGSWRWVHSLARRACMESLGSATKFSEELSLEATSDSFSQHTQGLRSAHVHLTEIRVAKRCVSPLLSATARSLVMAASTQAKAR